MAADFIMDLRAGPRTMQTVSFKASDLSWFRPLLAVGLLLCASACGRTPDATAPAPPPAAAPQPAPLEPLPAPPPPMSPPPAANCDDPAFQSAAQANVASLRQLNWAPFRRPEIGWETYAPLIAHEIATECGPESPGFAAALAAWQARHRLGGGGIMEEATFAAMKGDWQARRPFVLISAKGICPDPPPPSNLADADLREGYAGKAVQLRPAALAAYRRMVAAARAASPEIAADARSLTIFSAFRSPAYDDARCARDQNCTGVTRAACSPHRTGLALDLHVGAAPGYGPDSSADPNRLFQSKTAAYRWMVANANRFGFVNYPFEPWHWEWVGEAP